MEEQDPEALAALLERVHDKVVGRAHKAQVEDLEVGRCAAARDDVGEERGVELVARVEREVAEGTARVGDEGAQGERRERAEAVQVEGVQAGRGPGRVVDDGGGLVARVGLVALAVALALGRRRARRRARRLARPLGALAAHVLAVRHRRRRRAKERLDALGVHLDAVAEAELAQRAAVALDAVDEHLFGEELVAVEREADEPGADVRQERDDVVVLEDLALGRAEAREVERGEVAVRRERVQGGERGAREAPELGELERDERRVVRDEGGEGGVVEACARGRRRSTSASGAGGRRGR